jgi:CDK-activating kinase assembly factor MAT1
MCESCVERIFSHGPAPCPVAGCRKVLKKNGFKLPTFDDLKMEREIDIRKTCAKVFNRRQDEFDTLRDYNDYLDDVEVITFNLVNNIDVEESRAKLEAYEKSNQDAIKENRELERMGAREEQARQAADKSRAQQMRLAAMEEDEEERREKVAARQDVINQLATGDGNAIKLAMDGERALLQKAHNRKTLPTSTALGETSNGSSIFSIKGLKKRVKAEPEKPYDPFGGMADVKEFVTLPTEPNIWDKYLGKVRKEDVYTAGGYDVREFYARTLSEAFSGLGVFISEEMAQKDHDAASEIATAGAALASQSDAVMTDVF